MKNTNQLQQVHTYYIKEYNTLYQTVHIVHKELLYAIYWGLIVTTIHRIYIVGAHLLQIRAYNIIYSVKIMPVIHKIRFKKFHRFNPSFDTSIEIYLLSSLNFVY